MDAKRQFEVLFDQKTAIPYWAAKDFDLRVIKLSSGRIQRRERPASMAQGSSGTCSA